MEHVSLRVGACLTQARIRYAAQALEPKRYLERQQERYGDTSPKGIDAQVRTCEIQREGQGVQARAMLTLSFVSTSAPFASSARTTSKWPFSEAKWSGVRPSCGAGEHRGQGLPPLSSRGPQACPHHKRPMSRTHWCH
jgi:hypothetical protein